MTYKIRHSIQTQCVLVVCALLCALTLGSSAAHAQAGGNLVIAKTLGQGQEGEPPVDGALFDISLLEGLTVSDEKELNQLIINSPQLLTSNPGYPMKSQGSQRTDAQGLVRFEGLPAGVYQVREVSQRSGNAAENLATPFLAGIDEGETELVRAKNQPNVVVKSTEATNVAVGDKTTYRVEANAPAPDVNGKLHQYVLRDPLDERLDFDRVIAASISNLNESAQLNENKDFSVEYSNNLLTFELAKDGLSRLAQLRDGHPETRVQFEFDVHVNETASEGDTISNTAFFSPDGYDSCTVATACDVPAEESNEVTIRVDDVVEPEMSSAGSWWWAIPGFLGLGWLIGEGANHNGASESTAPNTEQPGQHAADGDPAETSDSDERNDGSASNEPDAADRTNLAETGASVIGIVIVGLIALLIGLMLLRRNRRDEQENHNSVLVMGEEGSRNE